MMPHLKLRCFLFFIISFFCSPVLSLVKKQYEIHDLTSTDPTLFAADVAEWEVEGKDATATALYTTCGTTLLLGGPGVLEKFAYFKRTYKDLDSHSGISGQISFWLIDNWRLIDDMIFIRMFDEVSTNIAYGRHLGLEYNAAAWGTSDCGSTSYSDLKNAKLNFRFPHSGSTLTIQIYSTHPMDANPSSYGIRDVKLLLHKDAPSTVVCSHPGNLFDPAFRCSTCANNQFYIGGWFPSCNACGTYDDACVDNNKNPFVCKSDATLRASDPSNCYCDACHSSCLTCSVAGSDTDCLSCHTGTYLFRNETCLPTCPYTITTVGSITYCDFTCLSLLAPEFLFENGTCKTACPLPYVVRDVNIGKHCDFPCSPNGFAYPDNACRSTCPSPMKKKSESSVIKFCLPPCDDDLYYYPDEKVCKPNCPYPREVKKDEFYFYCDQGSSAARAFAAMTSFMNVPAAEVINKGTLAASFIFLGQSWGIFVGAYTRLFQNVRYINASYATHTELMVENWNTSLMTLEFFPPVPDTVVASVPNNPKIEVFEMYKIHTSFLVSAWRASLSVLTMLVLFILLKCIEWMASKSGQPSAIVRYLRLLAQNSFIITFYGNFGYFVLYSVIEYRSLNLENANGLSILSFIAAIAFLLAVLASMILHFLFLRKRRKIVTKADWTENYTELKAFTKANGGFQVLFIDFKDKYQSFLLIFMLRDICCNLTVATLTNFPLHQTGIMSVFNVVWVFYLYSNRPLRRMLDQVQQTFFEVLLLIANSSSFVTTVLDDVENDDVSLREILAKAIMLVTMIYSFSVFVFFGLKAANMIYDIYKIRKAMKDPNSVDKQALAQQQGILGDLLGLDNVSMNQDQDNQDSSFLANDSKLESNSLIKNGKNRALRVKRPKEQDISSGIIDEHYKRKDLVMDNSNLRVHVGRFGKGKPSEKDLKKPKGYREDSFEGEVAAFQRDGRKNLSDFRPKRAEEEKKPSHKMPETDLRCKEKSEYDENIRREQAQNNLDDYRYPGFLR